MQFNHPEVLYALFLLIIPILIHLFQLRRFKKEAFTNVKFLRKLSEQTRKSSQLKKWLVLISRLLIFTCIILAFAQPYFNINRDDSPANVFIYLDNSYSMQAKAKQGQLFQNSKQELLKSLPENKNITLFTNDAEYADVTRKEIQEIDFTPTALDLNTLLLKIKSLTANSKRENNLLLFSDQQNLELSTLNDSIDINLFSFNLQAKDFNNIAIDTAFVSDLKPETSVLNVKLSSFGNPETLTTVSLYDNEKLLGKTGVKINEEKDTVIQFQLQKKAIEKGIIKIEDNGLDFDNIMFFNINEIRPINIVNISNSEDLFLKKIYTQPQFNLTTFTEDEIDYNSLENAQVIILNELSKISNSLQNTLLKKAKENTIFIFIPSLEIKDVNIKLLIKNLGLPEFSTPISNEKLITGISYKDPIFEDAFEKQVSNFDYPKVQNYYDLDRSNGTALLRYEDLKPFLIKISNKYVFTAPINQANSNFLQSPLVVLSFYNIGLSALKPSQLYYTLGASNNIDIPVKTKSDKILELRSKNLNFIPQQQQFSDRVRISTTDFPKEPGNLEVWFNDQPIYNLSYNVNRDESKYIPLDLENYKNIHKIESLSEFINLSGFTQEVDSFWKWFVTFALFFLIIETLLLKYFK